MRASLEVVAAALQHATELASLEEDHRTLQTAFVDREARIRELEQELHDGYAAAAPFVQFVERRYGLMRHQRDEARESLAECLNARDNAAQLARLRERLRLAEEIHSEETTRLHIQIADLESRLAAARSTAAAQKSRRLAQRVTALSGELAAATMELASSRDSLSARDQALANATAELQAHEVSQKALEDSVTQFQNQVSALERRLSRSHAELSTVYAARDRFSDEAVAAEAESLRLASELKQAVVERDCNDLVKSQVNSFRAAIARLEGRVSDLQSNHNRLQTLEKEIRDLQGANASLETDVASVRANRHVLETQCEQLTRERDSMRASRDHAVQERDAIRTQVATLASSVSASSGGAALQVLITGGLPVVGAGYLQFRRGGIHAKSTTVETETREETDIQESSIARASVLGAGAIRSTVEAGADPGESVQTEVFQSQEADGSIVTKTVKTTTRITKSSSGELVKTVEVETTTETETTSGEKSTTVETETREETDIQESSIARASVLGAGAIRSTVEAGAAPGESVQTEVFQSQEADGSIVTKTVKTT
ncbi:Hypothetical protein PHPALM_7859, partial [Phytophthora palmivora]